MTCHDAQANLSFYLYGELEFAAEEALEDHLNGCPLCRRALTREKELHAALNAGQASVPFELLSQCRQDLKAALSNPGALQSDSQPWWRRLDLFGFTPTRWSLQVAAASFLLFVGFSTARFMDRNGLSFFPSSSSAEMGVLGPTTDRIRDIQPVDSGHVRIIVDHVQPREISGSVDSQDVRHWLLAAMQEPYDPGLRVDSVEILKGQIGNDVRDALLASVQHDSNAAVRLKALEGLHEYAADPVIRQTLTYVLQHDDNPGVRSEAIDLLALANRQPTLSPQVVQALQQVLQSQTEDDYIRLRCLQLLQDANSSVGVY